MIWGTGQLMTDVQSLFASTLRASHRSRRRWPWFSFQFHSFGSHPRCHLTFRSPHRHRHPLAFEAPNRPFSDLSRPTSSTFPHRRTQHPHCLFPRHPGFRSWMASPFYYFSLLIGCLSTGLRGSRPSHRRWYVQRRHAWQTILDLQVAWRERRQS